MNASNHRHRIAVKAAWAAGGAAVTVAVCLTAQGVCDALGDGVRGLTAGYAVIIAAFLACWLIFGVLPPRHPATPRRRSRGRDPETASPAAMTEDQRPAQLAA